jgi:hypothetical protein
MTPQEILIQYMYDKHNYLIDHGVSNKYMNKKLECIIKKWDFEKSKKIIKYICSAMKYKKTMNDSSICPFCHYQNFKDEKWHHCLTCDYQRINGYCGDKQSVYYNITGRDKSLCGIFDKEFLMQCKSKMLFLLKNKSR